MAATTSDSAVVTLNVGGRLFVTAHPTLTKYTDSMLAGMFRGDIPSGAQHGGGLFIDRDPTHFPTILAFLRDGRVPLPKGSLERQQLRAEAEYYSLTELVAAIDEALAEAAAAQQERAAAEEARTAEERAAREAQRARDVLDLHRAGNLRQAVEALQREEVAMDRCRAAAENNRLVRQGLAEWLQGIGEARQRLEDGPDFDDRLREALDMDVMEMGGDFAALEEAEAEVTRETAKRLLGLRAAHLAYLC